MKRAAFLLLFLGLASSLSAVEGETLDVGRADLEQALRAVLPGGSLVLEGVSLGLGSLKLDRFEAFAEDAQIVIHGAAGDTVLGPPDNRYFKGYVTGDLGSRVVLSVTSGGIRGLASSGGKYWLLGRGKAAKAPVAGMTVVEVDSALAGPGFTCASNQLTNPLAPAVSPSIVDRHSSFPSLPEGSTTYGAKIGVETDQEFLALFGGDTSAATDYVGDLIAHNSAIYSDEVDTGMVVSHLSLWTSTDPWSESSTICGLFEFGRYWNDNNGGIERTIAHFMSGKNNGGGVAWVGVLCSSAFNFDSSPYGCSLSPAIDNYGGAYGYSGDMDGDFDINNPSVVWDIVVTSHEMGHNFNSPHTHCYQGIGDPSAVDNCYAGECGNTGCYCGSPSLPSGCPGPGSGCGTIMSYCHLLGGGLANISLTFGNPGGVPFTYGIEPERVPARMSSHVVSTAGGNPSCLAALDIFADGFESGDVSAWSSSSP